MLAALTLLLSGTDLAELHRFPSLEATNTHIRLLIDQRYFIKLQFAVDRKNAERWAKALRDNDAALAAWEARGGLAEEEERRAAGHSGGCVS